VNRLSEIFENMPDTTSEVKIKDIAVIDFGNGVNMVTLESHHEEQHLKDAGKYSRIIYSVKGNNLCERRRRKNSEARLHRHSEDE
jgi:hypothetical protein